MTIICDTDCLTQTVLEPKRQGSVTLSKRQKIQACNENNLTFKKMGILQMAYFIWHTNITNSLGLLVLICKFC